MDNQMENSESTENASTENAQPPEHVEGMTESELTGNAPGETQPAAPEGNSGTQPPNFDGTAQTPQPSNVEPNFNAQVSEAANATTEAKPDESGALPGGVTVDESAGELVLEVNYDDEMKTYTFAVAENTEIVIDDTLSGAASVSLTVSGVEDGLKHGYITVRIIGDHASRVYLFRKDTPTQAVFTAKFTPHP